jgi:hypothetical protein
MLIYIFNFMTHRTTSPFPCFSMSVPCPTWCCYYTNIAVNFLHHTMFIIWNQIGRFVIKRLIDRLLLLLFYVPLKNISIIWWCHHCRWRATKFRPMLGAQGLWAGRDLYRATPAVTRDLGFSGLIRRTAPFTHLLRHTKGSGESILTRIITGPHSFSSYDTQGGVEDLT